MNIPVVLVFFCQEFQLSVKILSDLKKIDLPVISLPSGIFYHPNACTTVFSLILMPLAMKSGGQSFG
jgi:hypothetical protein